MSLAFAVYFASLALAIILNRQGVRRPLMVIGLPLLALDCGMNLLLLGNSLRNTVSAEAWRHRKDPDFHWCWLVIDLVFGENHCQRQSEREERFHGAWAAWYAAWQGKQ